MLNKHYTTAVLTLAILVTWGNTPKSVASSDKVTSYSFLKDKITTLQENFLISSTDLTIKSQHHYNYTNNSKGIIFAQDITPESNSTSNKEDQSPKLWWLVPLIILVPFLGFWLFKPSSGSKTEQINEQETSSENSTNIPEVSSPTPENIPSELAVDSSVMDKLTPEDAQEDAQEDAKAEEDNISTEASTFSQVLDDIEEQVENTNIPSAEAITTENESYEQDFSLEDSPSLEESIPPASFLEAEEIISESFATPESELASPDIEAENFESISAEELTTLESITQSQPDLLTKTEETSTEILPQQTEQITDQDLANISEWLSEKIDSDNKDVSVMDDFWDNLSSITEEITGEIPPQQTEQITDQELANISEWLNEKVDSNSNVSDVAKNSVDNLADVVEGKEIEPNEELLTSSLNLEDEQNQNNKTKEGISDSTSNFLEELLNEDSSQEQKH